jgi:hypothetical protein
MGRRWGKLWINCLKLISSEFSYSENYSLIKELDLFPITLKAAFASGNNQK